MTTDAPCPICKGQGRYETYVYLMNRKRLQFVQCNYCKATGIAPSLTAN